jgi:hypothetical protein
MPAPSSSWLRRCQARPSVRSLMLIVLVVGGGLGWIASQRQREVRRQGAIATIRASLASVDFEGGEVSRICWFGGSVHPDTLPQGRLTADQADALGTCGRLKELSMVTAAMTDEGLAALSRDRGLERLYCFKPAVTDAGAKHLAGLGVLKKLELLRAPGLTDAALAHLAGLADLEEINLSGARIDGSGLVHLAGLKKLGTLILPDTALDDAGLTNLGRLAGLRRLYIGGGTYTDAGLAHLAGLADLKELGIGSPGCTDAGLAHLAGLTNLRTLNVYGPQVTDAWIGRIASMKGLRQVDIGGARVSDGAVEGLRRALPEAEVSVDGRLR